MKENLQIEYYLRGKTYVFRELEVLHLVAPQSDIDVFENLFEVNEITLIDT